MICSSVAVSGIFLASKNTVGTAGGGVKSVFLSGKRILVWYFWIKVWPS